MIPFAAAARQADVERRPVVEGFTARLDAGADTPAVLARMRVELSARFPVAWELSDSGTGWLDARPAPAPKGTDAAPLPLGEAWDAVHALERLDGVAHAEPLLLIRVPSPDEQDANTRLGLWGVPYSEETRKKIDEASKVVDWSLAKMRVPAAWAEWEKKQPGVLPGAGILIAHPDTGYTPHPQISGSLELPGKDFVDPTKPDASDPLFASGLIPNPGHGTSTASVIVSPGGDASAADVRGVAPGARVLPLRVSTSVVHFSFDRLSLALEEAVRRDAHVVSMSLGGPKASERLRSAVTRALDAGIVVVSAAGNMVPTVVFPAALPGIVALAASNPLEMPWRFSSFGEEVVVTAPGERVWHAQTNLANGKQAYLASRGDGTSFATAAVAGVAALWLSYHGRDALIARYGRPLLAFAFHRLLTETANAGFKFIRGGKGGFGAGIVDAQKLLTAALPPKPAVAAYRDRVMARARGNWLDLTLRELGMLFRVPTSPEARERGLAPDSGAITPDPEQVASLVRQLLGTEEPRRALVDELGALIAAVPLLQRRFQLAARTMAAPGPAAVPLGALRRALLQHPLSADLAAALKQAPSGAAAPAGVQPAAQVPREPAAPPFRRLRAYAFDPSLATRLETAVMNQVTIAVRYERDLRPGPVGDYLEVVDVDPATDCAYLPVDLNHPHLLAQDGLAPSEGNPQFHQQMVYAVAMKTIHHFEEALGRPMFWAPLRPWLRGSGDDRRAAPRIGTDGKEDRGDRFVQRLRIYPHALREENAYYSPAKRALLLGYFPAREGDPGNEYPGGMVFTCLSHDVVAHETTHALLDGMHPYFNEPTNPDVFAFHEAFADIVALFQHFSYPEVLRHQIGRTQGDLTSENLLGQLARQFGAATGKHHSLRDAIGGLSGTTADADAGAGTVSGPAGPTRARAPRPRWARYEPDPRLLDQPGYAEEAHNRGSILVAAVFDAFLAIYGARIADLLRIATGGTGVLPAGRLHPDLVNRMASEAARSAQHVLRICVRAMDYVPPVDVTFGEFLRALITADRDLVADDDRGYRVAFIEAFRSWGIYPRDVRTLSEESLRWQGAGDLKLFDEADSAEGLIRDVQRSLLSWKPGLPREEIFESIRSAQRRLSSYLTTLYYQPWARRSQARSPHPLGELLRRHLPPDAEDIRYRRGLSIANFRPARRIGPDGQFLTEMVFEVVRTTDAPIDERAPDGPTFEFRGGVTFIVNPEDWSVRYCIYKSLTSQRRQRRQRTYEQQPPALGFGAAEYQCGNLPAGWKQDRVTHREAMRASSCTCRGKASALQLAEPFALLHRREGDEPPAAPAAEAASDRKEDP